MHWMTDGTKKTLTFLHRQREKARVLQTMSKMFLHSDGICRVSFIRALDLVSGPFLTRSTVLLGWVRSSTRSSVRSSVRLFVFLFPYRLIPFVLHTFMNRTVHRLSRLLGESIFWWIVWLLITRNKMRQNQIFGHMCSDDVNASRIMFLSKPWF